MNEQPVAVDINRREKPLQSDLRRGEEQPREGECHA
jgi:hypothetical protein